MAASPGEKRAGALGEYRRKRDPARTPEPVPPEPDSLEANSPDTDSPDARAATSGSEFVIQEHHARSLHWDLRLERDGVLVSWAVPRGLPADPGTNHLAVHTEDHPLEYAEFSGEIPHGEYGGGTMTIWDHGSYETLKWTDREVMVVLHGDRVEGRFVLFHTDGKNWMAHRMDGPVRPDWQPLPARLQPMLAVPGRMPPSSQDAAWCYETDWPGVRALAFAEGGRVRLVSADGDQLPSSVTDLRGLGEALGLTQVLLDGVLVAFDDAGRPSLQAIEARLRAISRARGSRARAPAVLLFFDLLHLDGRPIMHLPYLERRELLHDLPLDGPAWKVSPTFTGGGAAVRTGARDQGFPGILAKKANSRYHPGRLSKDWRAIRV